MTPMWRKSSFSFSNGNCIEVADLRAASGSLGNGECVEVGKGWRKSSASASNGHCVEVAPGPLVAVRDSKDPAGPVLAFSPAAWRAFTRRGGR
jgi:hypothetical protein